jgi:CO dehydrogenase/acetyl-CoA synthase beta subunit
MKKLVITIVILSAFASCKKDCGCFDPVKATAYPRINELGIVVYSYTGKYRDKCGNTKTIWLNEWDYKDWAKAQSICE